ncbi:protein MAINTENANCE OF MERISTEMS-like [Papaver somniferum]|uniref:protein MAINTENANCE OF MERISTEMS-like n=1 Tax=Papaver somniferum TaxID=3469 RepID=UPI000E7043EE|nr:protein MAINTENANCE OF MERISTEMS-like [Papaver somniferum]
MLKKKVDENCSRSNEPIPPLGQEHQFETPQPSKSSIMTYLRYQSYLHNLKNLRLDHARCIKLLKRQRGKHWPLSQECALVRNLVASTGLRPGILHLQWEYDSVVVSSFRERYWLETDTFHLLFGETTITPDDEKQITDLEFEGQSVFEGFDNNMSWTDLYILVQEILGWEKDETEMEFQLDGGYDPAEPHKPKIIKKLLLKNLRTKFEGTATKEREGQVMDETTVRRTTTTYLLYYLGTVFFPDNSGNRVNVHYLQLLKNLDNIKNYSWATATLAYLLDSLRKASRVGATEIAGNVALLMAWVYDHFPSLRPPTEWEEHDYGPTGKKFKFTGRQLTNKEDKLIQMREKIDSFTVEDVIFDPYLRIENGVDVRRFTETTGYVMTNPRRTLRQITHIQQRVVEENFKLSKQGSETKVPTIVLNYRPTSNHQPSSRSEETNDEEVVHGVGTSQRGGRGSHGGRRDGPKTRGGGSTNKRVVVAAMLSYGFMLVVCG